MFAVRLGLAWCDLRFVGPELCLRQGDSVLARLGSLSLARLDLIFKLGQLIKCNLMLGLDVCDRLLGCPDFTWGGVTVEHPQEQPVDHFLIVSLGGNELGDSVVTGNDRIVHRWSADQRHDRAKLQVS